MDVSLLWNLAFLCMGLGLLYVIFILFFKDKFSKKALKKASKRAELAPIISNFLFHSLEDSKDEQKEYVQLKIEIREYLRDTDFRRILAEILFDLQKDVSGTTEERLFRLYRELGLHHDAFVKLKSWRWQIIAKGILELTQMQVAESYHIISKFINDKRSTIRKQAEIAIVKLRYEGIEYILDTTIYAISEWQQLKIIEALSSLEDYKPPKFKSWLISENKDVVLFALRLIKHYNQNTAAVSIIELIKHKNHQIKLAAIQCVKDFNFVKAKATLRAIFLECNDEVKIQILDAIAVLGDESDIPFLNGVSIKETNFLVSSKASSAINTIAPGTVLPTKNIAKTKTSGSELEVLISEEKKTSIIDSSATSTILMSEDHVEIDESESKNIVIEEVKEHSIDLEESRIDLGDEDNEQDILSSKNDIVMEKNSNKRENEDVDINMDMTEKETYPESTDENEDTKEIELLEMIMERQASAELRYNAFKKLKNLKKLLPIKKKQETALKENLELEKPMSNKKKSSTPLAETKIIIDKSLGSVFYPLFLYAKDLNSKLLLIKEMESLGDEKEISFLQTLLNASEPEIAKLSKKVMTSLEQKLKGSSSKTDTLDTTKIHATNAIEMSLTKLDLSDTKIDDLINSEPSFETENDTKTQYAEVVKEDNRLPVELCFLYDEFGISASKEKDDDFDFKLSEEFFLNLNNSSKGHEH